MKEKWINTLTGEVLDDFGNIIDICLICSEELSDGLICSACNELAVK